eukprot:scaffold66922_cov14-Prasinocladus_malaysianus.AAC.1
MHAGHAYAGGKWNDRFEVRKSHIGDGKPQEVEPGPKQSPNFKPSSNNIAHSFTSDAVVI